MLITIIVADRKTLYIKLLETCTKIGFKCHYEDLNRNRVITWFFFFFFLIYIMKFSYGVNQHSTSYKLTAAHQVGIFSFFVDLS